MKRSISPFRKSPFTDALKQPKTLTLLSTAFLITAIASCQLEAPDTGKAEQLKVAADTPVVAPPPRDGSGLSGFLGQLAGKPNPVYVKALAPAIPAVAEPPLVFEAGVDGCDAPDSDLVVRFPLHSPFAVHDLVATVTTHNGTDYAVVEVEGAHARFATEVGEKARVRAKVCAALAEKSAGAPHFTADQRLVDAVQNWARYMAPDCDVTLAREPGGGLDCRLPQADPELARQELVGIRSAMIRGWSRQPYLLTRRVAIGIELADALQGPEPMKRLDTICKVLKLSLTSEMPATMTSQRWQQVACSGEPPARKAAALFGLQKTVAEIDFLRQVFERTSKLGMLSVRVPVPPGAGDKFLVSLTPQADVVDSLARATAQILAADEDEARTGKIEAPRACWHPLYAETPALLKLARHLAMAGEVTNVECDPAATTDNAANAAIDVGVDRYFAESIASETEFVLQNGRSKTLRLPVGKYAYTIRTLPDSPEDWDDALQSAQESKGQIMWDERRPRAQIGTW